MGPHYARSRSAPDLGAAKVPTALKVGAERGDRVRAARHPC